MFCIVWLVFCCCLLECQSVFRESATTEGINFNSRYRFWVPPIRRWMFFNDRSFLAGFFTYNKVIYAHKEDGSILTIYSSTCSGADLGGGCRGCAPLPPEMTCGFLIQLVYPPKKTMWFIGVEVEQETSAPPPKKNPGSAPVAILSFRKN